MKRPLLTLATALAIAACSHDSTGPDIRPGNLALERARWVALGITNYDFEYTYSNEWFPATRSWIEVRGGNVFRVVDLATGNVVGQSGPSNWPTVDSLFTRAEQLIEWLGGDYVTVMFDNDLHFPAQITADHPNWADEAQWIGAGNLVRR